MKLLRALLLLIVVIALLPWGAFAREMPRSLPPDFGTTGISAAPARTVAKLQRPCRGHALAGRPCAGDALLAETAPSITPAATGVQPTLHAILLPPGIVLPVPFGPPRSV